MADDEVSAKNNMGGQENSSEKDTLEGKYVLLQELGRGASGIVYKARHIALDRVVAVKIIEPRLFNSDTSIRRFQNEAAVLSSFSHANIVRFNSFGTLSDGRQYMEMEYLEGESLSTILAREIALTQARALPIFLDIAEALSYAHERGIVHRDIKPGNIFIQKVDSKEVTKLLDFGIYKSVESVGSSLTQTGLIVGSANYMSPEQCRSESVDARADIYSLGCVMYETLVGKAPFHAESDLAIMSNHLTQNVECVSAANTIANKLEMIILRCLHKNKELRIQNARELIDELNTVSNSRGRKRRRSPRAPLLAFSIALLVCLVFVGAFVFRHRKAVNKSSNEGLNYRTITTTESPTTDDPVEQDKLIQLWLKENIEQRRDSFFVDALYKSVRCRAQLFDTDIPPYAAEVEQKLLRNCSRITPLTQAQSAVLGYVNLAVVQQINGKPNDAQQTLAKAIRLANTYEFQIYVHDAFEKMADIEMFRGNYQESLAILRKATLGKEREAVKISCWLKIPAICRKLGRTEKEIRIEALRALEALDSLFQRDLAVYPGDIGQLSSILMEVQVPNKIIELFALHYPKEKLKKDSESAALQFWLSKANFKAGNIDLAKDGFLQVTNQYLENREIDSANQTESCYLACLAKKGEPIFPEMWKYLKLVRKLSEKDYLKTLLSFQDSSPGLGLKNIQALRDAAIEAASKNEQSEPELSGKLHYYEASHLTNEGKYKEALDQCKLAENNLRRGQSYDALIVLYETICHEMTAASAIQDFELLESAYKRVQALKSKSPSMDFCAEVTYAHALKNKDIGKAIEIDQRLLDKFKNKSIQFLAYYDDAVCQLDLLYKAVGQLEKGISTADEAYIKLKRYRADQINELTSVLNQLISLSKKPGNEELVRHYQSELDSQLKRKEI